jgi:predicted dehydrogenase
MEKTLHWGLLSTARINRALIKPLNASKMTRLLAVASRSQPTADAYACKWNIPRAHGSYEALLNDPEVDVIYISLPNHLHAEWAVKALRAGKHVLCEKPLALSMDEFESMCSASKQAGRILAEAFMYRHHAQTFKIKEMVDGGSLGHVLLIKGSFHFKLTRPEDYRNFREMGGGSIWDVGCYPVSFARMLIGEEPREVFGWQVAGPGGADETFIGQMRFPGGVLFQFDCGFTSPVHTSIEIVGTEGIMHIPRPFKPGVVNQIVIRRGEGEEWIKVRGGDLYLGEVEDMCNAIRFDQQPRVTLEDSRGNLIAILACLESARRGRPILFNETT